MEAAAAAARNNRPDEAKAYRQAARVSATTVGTAHRNVSRHWSVFGPVTVAVKALEDSMVIGDARAVVRKAGEQEELSPKAWKRLGRPSTNDGNRFTLDVARAHTRTNALVDALDRTRRAPDSHLPEACHVVVQRDRAVAGVDELAAFAVGTGPAKPCLGVFEHVERLVPNSGDTSDPVSGPLAVAGRAFPLAGDRVFLLLKPAVFDVAGQAAPSTR
jgi:hypothetical protein